MQGNSGRRGRQSAREKYSESPSIKGYNNLASGFGLIFIILALILVIIMYWKPFSPEPENENGVNKSNPQEIYIAPPPVIKDTSHNVAPGEDTLK